MSTSTQVINEKLESLSLGLLAAKTAIESKSEQVKLLDLQGVSDLTSFVLIVSANSQPHLKALAREIKKRLAEKLDEKPVYEDGEAMSRWIVIDYIDLIVHVMTKELCDFYQLDRLWPKSKEVELPLLGAE